MARSDTLLTGSIMAMIAMALVFDDDDGPPIAPNPQPSLSDDPAVDDDGAICDDNGRAGISVSFTRF